MNTTKSIMLDTAFLIRLYSDKEKLHNNCKEYYHYFLEKKISMFVSTISIAEYCVKAPITDIQFDKFRILPFNIQHAQKAGKFHKVCYDVKGDGMRDLIKNDTKLLAQVAQQNIDGFITSDKKIQKIVYKLQSDSSLNIQFKYFDIETGLSEHINDQPSLNF